MLRVFFGIAGTVLVTCASYAQQTDAFLSIDRNEDGVIDSFEADAHVDVDFSDRDVDQDGWLTLSDFEQAMVQEARRSGAKVTSQVVSDVIRPAARQQLQMLDHNQDGSVSKAEYREGQAVLFKRMDRNGDGKISREEFDRRRGE
ncbi:EF-hand domain-containing protein [Pseudoxanthomonas sp. GM95]|uniref:EF-hand domain-containing protein n=1 Tax=Pseudoxanthomonas sp. GM95 TaxID=1881043 RepID=UPI0015877CDD|nr:EF-hand domain-containing protein [Pseudoxanthomonas sp. GM95]